MPRLTRAPACSVHDGSWKSCPGGHEVRDFAREVREAWDKVNRGESRLDDDE